jgi:hypothetical protein
MRLKCYQDLEAILPVDVSKRKRGDRKLGDEDKTKTK